MASEKVGSAFVEVTPKLSGEGAFKSKVESSIPDGSPLGAKFGGALMKGALAAVAAGAAAVVAGVGAIGKAAFDGYKDFEQLQGGISKLYGNAGQSLEEYAASVGQTVDEARSRYGELTLAQNTMLAQADNAWKTAGMSANQYLETATSFSASLISSLGGDTVAAAKMTDRAMTAISDNVNTFGSDMQSVQNAFQGFAKQNYTMLDNLKLGYAGTKEGMEQLIADANEWGAANGEAADLSIDSFSDVVVAIEQVQKKQGIYGTTQKEALSTVEGSLNATKAAWDNFVTGLGRGPEMVQDTVPALVEAATAAMDNIIPVIETIATSMADALPKIAPKALELGVRAVASMASGIVSALPGIALSLFEFFASLPGQIAETLGDASTGIAEALIDFGALFDSFYTSLGEIVPQILEGIGTLISDIVTNVTQNAPAILAAAQTMFSQMLNAVIEYAPQVWTALVTLLQTLITTVIENGPSLLASAVEFILNILSAILQAAPQIISGLLGAVMDLINLVISNAPAMLAAGLELIGGVIDAVIQKIPEMATEVGNLVQKGVDAVGEFVGEFFNAGANLIGGLINGVASKAGELVAAAKGAVDGAIQSAKEALGIASPSKVFMEIGGYTMEGFEVGVDKGAADAKSAVADVLDGAYYGARARLDVVQSMSPIDGAGAASDGLLAELRSLHADMLQLKLWMDSKVVGSLVAPSVNRELGRMEAAYAR